MKPEKKQIQTSKISTTVSKAIRLKPSTTDYVTFAATTARAMGVTGPLAPRTKPNKRVLWLANSKS